MRTIALSLGWLISFTYRRLIANPDPPLPARGEPQWAEATAKRQTGAKLEGFPRAKCVAQGGPLC